MDSGKNTLLTSIKNLFKPSESRLRAEGTDRANEKFNIINEDGTSYLVYGRVKISTKAESDNGLLDRLYELRRMYVDLYVECEGRI